VALAEAGAQECGAEAFEAQELTEWLAMAFARAAVNRLQLQLTRAGMVHGHAHAQE